MNKQYAAPSFFRFDLILIFCVLGLMALGLAFIYSSGVTADGVQISNEWIKQIIWGASGLVILFVFAFVDYRHWKRLALPLYLGTLVLLCAVLLFGSYVNGSRAWLGIGPVGIQPSEFAKIALILLLASWFDEGPRDLGTAKSWLVALTMTGVTGGLVLIQPDMGTAFVYVPIFLAMSLIAGVPLLWWFFPVLIGSFTIAGVLGIAWNQYIAETPAGFFRLFTESSLLITILPALGILCLLAGAGWLIFKRRIFAGILYGLGTLTLGYIGAAVFAKMLRGYQMMRLVVFLDPQIDPRGAGWHIIQSVTAVGSGGLMGKGFLKGTQSHYSYLPEQNTDFIFSILSEEMGFFGGILVFSLFGLIIVRALYIALTANNRFGTYTAIGVAAMISFHLIQNIGMAIGVMPIVGIPLFFLSYGGSSLWTGLMGMGLLLSIHNRRYR